MELSLKMDTFKLFNWPTIANGALLDIKKFFIESETKVGGISFNAAFANFVVVLLLDTKIDETKISTKKHVNSAITILERTQVSLKRLREVGKRSNLNYLIELISWYCIDGRPALALLVTFIMWDIVVDFFDNFRYISIN